MTKGTDPQRSETDLCSNCDQRISRLALGIELKIFWKKYTNVDHMPLWAFLFIFLGFSTSDLFVDKSLPLWNLIILFIGLAYDLWRDMEKDWPRYMGHVRIHFMKSIAVFAVLWAAIAVLVFGEANLPAIPYEESIIMVLALLSILILLASIFKALHHPNQYLCVYPLAITKKIYQGKKENRDWRIDLYYSIELAKKSLAKKLEHDGIEELPEGMDLEHLDLVGIQFMKSKDEGTHKKLIKHLRSLMCANIYSLEELAEIFKEMKELCEDYDGPHFSVPRRQLSPQFTHESMIYIGLYIGSLVVGLVF